jgi:hypothetical protein
MNWTPTDGDESRLHLRHPSFIAKRVKCRARFNDIDGTYHAITHSAIRAMNMKNGGMVTTGAMNWAPTQHAMNCIMGHVLC